MSPISRFRSTGAAAYMREVPVERIYREVRLLRLYEGTSEIQRLDHRRRPGQGRSAQQKPA